MSIRLSDLTREPEFLEKTFHYCEKNKLFRCVSISAKINRPLSNNLAYGALRSLVLKYPLLFSRIAGEEPHVRYEPIREILFADVFSVNTTVDKCLKDKDAETSVLTDMTFYENYRLKKAMWKLVYYEKTGWVTFHSAHSFTDGGSVVAYLKDFVESLNHVTDAEAKSTLFSLDQDLSLLKYPISPGFLERVNYQADFATKLFARGLKLAIWYWPSIVPKVVEKKRFELFFVGRAPEPFSPDLVWQSDHVIGANSPLNFTKAVFINFDTGSLGKMLAACRAHDVKLQSFILLVYAHTINTLYPELYSAKNLKTGVAASLRNRFDSLETHSSYLGNKGRFDDGLYTYAATFLLEPGTTFSWEAVKKYHDFIHEKVTSADWIKQYYIANQSLTAESYLDHRLDTEGDTLFLSSTNLGHIDVLLYEDEKYQIEDILFAPCVGALLGMHHVTVLSTAKGGLNLGLTIGDENVDSPKFKKAFSENLLLLANS
ncbi:Alcohol acetyltransferase [Metschnikowia aff. pulcherrima]|uniref:Alcohol acetyltransferase n=1 Tax=Metschnikowia aff. pulcherrima TaxID=2163413 RepID=A0A4P6XTQ4_9ASCO|nr:Alcohol acetyltransferase [Metschnikowia aff. pulcherrima]